jgi:hypothetical protein
MSDLKEKNKHETVERMGRQFCAKCGLEKPLLGWSERPCKGK